MKLFPIAMGLFLLILLAMSALLTTSFFDREIPISVDKDEIELLFLSELDFPYFEYVTEDTVASLSRNT